jgi:hypothetical protein
VAEAPELRALVGAKYTPSPLRAKRAVPPLPLADAYATFLPGLTSVIAPVATSSTCRYDSAIDT